ncbi:unnamed protein product [Parajaminaea phylloscopi]
MSWYSPRMDIGGSSPTAALVQPSSAPPRQDLPTAPQTPESVKNVGVEVCYNVSAFRELMQQYRQLDDGVTTRLNRALARSRSSGLSSSPSLLNGSSSSSGSPSTGRLSDLGTSTYATFPAQTCLEVWKELSANWKGRDSVIRYCVDVVDANAAHKSRNQEAGAQRLDIPTRDVDLLDADKAGLPGQQPPPRSPPRQQQHHEGYERVSKADSPLSSAEWDARESRAESTEDALRRQLHNEQTIDRIIRNRSLQAFRSRCNLFRLPPDASPEERRIWEEL